MLLDSTSIMLIMLPLALPVATALGVNLVWFGVVTTIAIEIGLLTPPFGLSVYVIKASMDDPTMTLATIFRGAFPFVLITLFVTLLLMAFPQISLVLLVAGCRWSRGAPLSSDPPPRRVEVFRREPRILQGAGTASARLGAEIL